MTATVTASKRGKANRDKGIKAERDMARYLRANGWPEAERKSDNGWRSSDRESADHGDIKNTPRLVWQSKYVADMSDLQIERAWRDAQTQAVAAGADFGILVERRPGKTDPGLWWAWVSVWDLHNLVSGPNWPGPPQHRFDVPVRLQARHLVALLHGAGYGAGGDANCAGE